MLQTEALVSLVQSLSASERKKFRSDTKGKSADYTVLYHIIESEGVFSSGELKARFDAQRKGAVFSTAVSYLYKRLLDMLLVLREDRDSHYSLFNQVLKARVLFEKALYDEALRNLEQAKKNAVRYENHIALLYASRLELEYLLFLNLPDISEAELLNKHFQAGEVLKSIRQIGDHSSLYELLKHRLIYKGNIRSQAQKEALNDLVISEMTITSSIKSSFEIKKQHLLFQSNYLIGIGDYASALQSFRELNALFEQNERYWAHQPFYYVTVLEGILDNLRSMRNYGEIPYFLERLRTIQPSAEGFRIQVSALIFLYELFPLLDKGDFTGCRRLISEHQEGVLSRTDYLSLTMRAEISLYLSVVHLGFRDYKAARKALLSELIRGNKLYMLPLYRTIRLVNLVIHYELGDDEIVSMETRSVKREISKVEKAYRVEHLVLSFLKKGKRFLLPRERERIWKKLEPELNAIRQDVFENQLLKSFDFTAWLESQVRRIPLSETLKHRDGVA